MEAFQIADEIRREIKRQAKDNLALTAANLPEKPDMMRVVGDLDLYELAKAVKDDLEIR
jgi:hypothetical protein